MIRKDCLVPSILLGSVWNGMWSNTKKARTMLKMYYLIWITMFRSDHLGFGINREENRGSVGVHNLKFN